MNLNKINLTLAKLKIESLDQLSSIDVIKKHLQDFLKNCPFTTIKMDPELSLYRAQKMSSNKFCENISRMSYPPRHLIKTNGRANRINQPILYLGQSGRTALFESRLSNNQFVAIAEYKLNPKATLNLHHVGFYGTKVHKSIKNAIACSKKDAIVLGLNSVGRRNFKILHQILGDPYLNNVEEGEESKYNFTIALTEHLLAYEHADGIIYPSTLSKNDVNIALKPESFHKIKIHNMLGLQTIETSQSEIIFKYIASSENINPNGIINWEFDKNIENLTWAENTSYPKNS
jgi:hypothetical protein